MANTARNLTNEQDGVYNEPSQQSAELFGTLPK